MAQKGWGDERDADDFIILCDTQEQAERALAEVRLWVEQAGLTLHPTKTRIVEASQRGGFDFLGYHFERSYRWPRPKSMDKFKEVIRGKTRRTRSGSMHDIVSEINRTLQGWGAYFKHSIANIFPELDSWIRGRLRSILRKRRKRKGRARGPGRRPGHAGGGDRHRRQDPGQHVRRPEGLRPPGGRHWHQAGCRVRGAAPRRCRQAAGQGRRDCHDPQRRRHGRHGRLPHILERQEEMT